jgi:SNF2 family DNA or RNA helicase
MELRPYQNEAADFLFTNDRAMILAPVGAGKTAITLTALQDMIRHGHINRVLVLAPLRVVKKVWPVERPLWAINLTMSLAVGTPKQRLQALQANTHIVVTNYDNLQWLATQKLNFDAIVFDELTRLKNPSGARFKALAKVIDPMRVRWGLTGSFTSNGLEDVFGQCKIVDQSLLGRSKGAFMQEYFILMNKEYGEWAPRKGSLEKVMARIKPATFVLEPGEYSDKLPPLHVVEMRCDMDRKDYEKMKKDLVLEYNDAKIVAVNAAVVTGKLQQMASGFVYNSFTEASPTPGKFKTTKTPIWFSTHKFDLLDELLQENQHAPTIVAYTFQEELAELKRRYPKALTLDDHNAIERWNTGKVELLFAHPKSAGHGLNLQHGGSRIVFLSLPWSLELFEQTVGRLHRSGQKHDVWCYILMTNKTVDERIWAGLNDNRALSDIAIEELKCA